MRTALVLACALLATLAPLPASAQAAGATTTTTLLEEGTGDLQMHVQGSAAGNPAGRYTSSDLASLSVTETPESLTFTVGVAGLDAATEVPFAETAQVLVGFVFRDATYRVYIVRDVAPGGAAHHFSFLELYDRGNAEFSAVAIGVAAADPATKTLSATFDRKVILDGDGNAPHPEMPLTGWNVQTTGGPISEDCRIQIDIGGQGGQDCLPVRVTDRMPDEGNGTKALDLRIGISQSGHARLRSDVPTRASNGEATTFVYQVEAQNLRDSSDRFQLATVGAPGNWQVKLPAPEVEVEAYGRITFPVLVTMPFDHDHGTLKNLVVEMRSMSDPNSVGRVQLGVRFPEPPQPAGHHDTLTLHSFAGPTDPLSQGFFLAFTGGSGARAYMNADESDPLDAGLDVPARLCNISEAVPPATTYCWNVPLSPGLQLGLDVDLATKGTLRIPLKTVLPIPGAVLSGEVVRIGPITQTTEEDGDIGFERTVTPLATIVPTAPVDIPPNSQSLLLETELTPMAEGDYMPYEEGASMMMQIRLTTTRPDAPFGPRDMPMLMPGGQVRLPLAEYHDKVDTIFSTNSTVRLTPLGEQDRLVNPGKTAVYALRLENLGTQEAEYLLELTGTNAQWARMTVGGTRLVVPAAGSTELQVALTVPAEAASGATADLVLTATQVDDLNVRTLARLFATVDADADHPDDAAIVAGAPVEETPLPLVAALAAVALALALRRRR